jgi:tRNA (Thr-GGU) A37 N-methylase
MNSNTPINGASREGVWLHPIGVVHSSRKEAAGTPLQPRMASGFLGELETCPDFSTRKPAASG